jgi:heptosyltransferase III
MSGILIIHQGALGDFIALFPAILMLKRKFPRVDAVCQDKLGKMAAALGVIDAFFPAESALFASLYSDTALPKLRTLLRYYNHIVLFSYSQETEHAIKAVTEKPVHRIRPRAPVFEPLHITEHILSNLMKCGMLENSDTVLSYPDTRNKSYDSKKILIHPGSGSRRKNWAVSNFIKTEAILRADGLFPEFIIGPAEEFLKSALQDSRRTVHLVSDLTELAEMLGTAGGFIGNDAGVSHLAAFIGLPTVAVFGPSDPIRWRPSGRAVTVLRPADLDCRGPCFEIGKNNCEKPDCLRTLPETVIKAFYSLCT